MKIHFFTKGDKSVPSSRLRGFLISDELVSYGFDSVVHYPSVELISKTKWPNKGVLILNTLKNISVIKKNDVIILQRTIYSKYFFILIIVYKYLFRRKIIFDFDDAIYLHSFFKTKLLTKMSNSVVVGSHALYDWAKKYNKNVYLIPTSIKYENYLANQKELFERSETFTIGWVGNGPAHYENLKIIKEVLLGLNPDKKIKFILVGAMNSDQVHSLFDDVRGVVIELIDELKPELVPEIIKTFDVGVMPLIDNKWSQGKCALKAIEYMACGVPTIVSPVGENIYLIKDGFNGYLAANLNEWQEKIDLLSTDANLVRQIGENGKKTIEDHYTFKVNIPRIIKIINKI